MLKNDVRRQLKRQDEEIRKNEELIQRPPLRVRIVNKLMNPVGVIKAVWHEMLHYFHGFRLFFLESKLCMRYLFKMARGKQLKRRERQQLIRTFVDTLRLLPFTIFIIVPFMEILLPFYIKLFPDMMPSTFQDISKEKEKNLKQLKAKVETAKLLQDTLEEIALIKKNRKEHADDTFEAYEFSQFIKKVRTQEEGYVSNADLFKYIKLFEDELTLENLSMSQLRALCRLLGISKLGNLDILRFRLHMKLEELRRDDKMIAAEGGVDVLSVQELQAACRDRGMRAAGLSEDRLKEQLRQWLELSMNDRVPPSLLLLSRAMYFPEELNFTERLRAVIAQLPEEISEYAIKLKELEEITDPKAKMEILRNIAEELKQERVTEAKQAKTDAGTIFIDAELEKAESTIEQLNEIVARAESQHDTKSRPAG